MIVLDTNVLSELMRTAPDPAVVAWLDAQPTESVWTTAITVFEVRYGLAILPDSKKRRSLSEAFERALEDELGGRILELNPVAAGEAATIAAKLREAGRPVDFRDVLIAGTVAARRGTLATRNTKHFAGADIALVDPWASAPA